MAETMFPPCAPFFHACQEPADRGLRSGKARLRQPSLLAFQLPSQGLGLNEVDERLLPFDFDDGYQFAVTSLEFGIAIDSDFFEFEVELSV